MKQTSYSLYRSTMTFTSQVEAQKTRAAIGAAVAAAK
jgi:hypothetical protein